MNKSLAHRAALSREPESHTVGSLLPMNQEKQKEQEKQPVRKSKKPTTEYKSYAEKLRDPRWQKMRLQIMERDKFTCRHCGDKDKTLNVHHHFYTKGAAPWEYEPESLSTLCEDCHELTEEGNEEIRRKTGDGSWRQTVVLNFIKTVDGDYPFSDLPFPKATEKFCDLVCHIGRARKSLDSKDQTAKGIHLERARSSLLNFIQYASESINQIHYFTSSLNEIERLNLKSKKKAI